MFDRPKHGFFKHGDVQLQKAPQGRKQKVACNGDTDPVDLCKYAKKVLVQGHNCNAERVYIMDNISLHMRRSTATSTSAPDGVEAMLMPSNRHPKGFTLSSALVWSSALRAWSPEDVERAARRRLSY